MDNFGEGIMEIRKVKCDICGKEGTSEDYKNPKGWYRIENMDVCKSCAGEDSGLKMAVDRLKVKQAKRKEQEKK